MFKRRSGLRGNGSADKSRSSLPVSPRVLLGLVVLLSHCQLALADHGGSEPHYDWWNLAVPATSSTGNYTITWGTTGAILQEKELGDATYSQIYEGASPKAITGKTNGTYVYRLVKWKCDKFMPDDCGWLYTSPQSIVVDTGSPPGVPGAISGPSTATDTTGNGTSYGLSWSAATGGVLSYQLQRRKNSGTWSTIQNTTSRTKSETGRTAGTYRYRVRACNNTGCSAYTSVKTVVVSYFPPPGVPGAISAPSTVYASGNNASYTLSWGAASGTVDEYELKRHLIGPGNPWESITPTTPLSHTEHNMDIAIYDYRVRACNSSGCSAYTPTKQVIVYFLPLPGVPGSISGPSTAIDTTGNGASFSLSWAASTGTVNTYKLQRRKNSGSWSTIRNTSSRSRSESGMTAATYQYRVSACNASGCGSYTAAKSVQVIYRPPPGVPGAISGPSPVYDSSGGGTAYSLSWGAASGTVTSYTLQRNSGGGWSTIQSSSARSRSESGMTDGTYQYRVRACNSSGCSSYTAIKSIEVIHLPPPGVPGAISVSPSTVYDSTGSGASYSLGWGAASGTVSRYELQKGGSTIQSSTVRSKTENETAGTYDYRVRACNVSGCSAYTATKSIQVLSAIAGDPFEAPPSAVGTTPYRIDVGSDGDGNISVPLNLIAGVAGFAPSLSLEYDSGRGVDRLERSLPEDTIGYGWRLAGLSKIRRCVVNQVSTAKIELDSSDSLCLNGMPLVRASGSHFTVGAIYRTLIESYIKIEIKGSTGALWFEATLPDGTVQEYGRTDGSRVDKNGGVDYQWSLNKATSVDGNVITYSWYRDSANGINYIANINYTNADVDFEYSPRTDAAPVPIDGAPQEQSVLLHTVRVSVGNKKVREYFLFDEEVSGRRRLNRIQQCGYDVAGLITHCLAPLDLAWITPSSPVSGVPVLVNGMTDGLGASHVFEYGTITGSTHSFLFTERPFGPGVLPSDAELLASSGARRFVATKLRRDNGLGGYHDTSFAYQNVGLESTKHWGFLGFYAQRITDEASGIVTYAQYRLDYPYFGRVARMQQYDAIYGSHTQMLARSEWDYTQQAISHTSGSSVYPYVNRAISFTYEGTSQLGATQTTHALTFSGGFVTDSVSTTTTGTGVSAGSPGSTWGDIPVYSLSGVVNTRENAASFTNRMIGGKWLINFPDAVTSTSWAGAPGGSGIVQPVTMSPRANSLQPSQITRFANDIDLTLVTDYGYDGSGRLTSTTVSGDSVNVRTTVVDYSGNDRYPYSTTNAEGHSTTFSEYDPRFGTVMSRGDPNAKTASWGRDAFGRVIAHTNGDSVTTTTSYTSCAAVCPTISGVAPAFYVEQDSGVTPIERVYYDNLGRVLRTEKQLLDGSYSKRDFEYDGQGRIKKTSLPYSTGTAENIVYTYDIRNRIINVLRPDGSSTATAYGASGGKVIATVTEAVKKADGSSDGSQVKRNEFNILGQLTKTTDAYGSSSAVSTTYTYDANGNLLTATVDGGGAGTTTTIYEYDAAGNRMKIIDPDIGTVTKQYTALGQLRTRLDNKGQQTTFNYDLIGRLYTRNDPYGLNIWTWDTAANGIGKLKSRSGPDGFLETYSYNGAGKLSTIVTEFIPIGGTNPVSYSTSHTYDSHGRPQTTTHPGGFELTRVYNARGYLSELRNGTTAIQTFNATDAFGHSTNETYGNGVETSRTYDPETGRLTDIDTSIGSTDLQDNEYGWRSNGILESRTARPVAGLSSTRQEMFSYDVLNRLEVAETWINGSNTRDLNYQYNALGNIESKTSTLAGDTDVTGYSYAGGSSGPHAVTSATVGGVVNTLTYDANGAITRYDIAGTTEDKWLAYNVANQPTKIVIGSGLNDATPQVSEQLRYDPDGRRYARQTIWQEDGTTRTEDVFYVGGVEIIYDNLDDEITKIIKTRIGPNIMHVKVEGLGLVNGHLGTRIESHFEYAHRDHLGSIEVVTGETGTILYNLAFEPFGSRRSKDWSGTIMQAELDTLLARSWESAPRVRGFTGHEHLDRTGFIHMNGRIYDPVLGRFLSPDPFVQFPTASDSWNRYSYVSNSPTSFTDPTGFRVEINGPDVAVTDVITVVGRSNGSSYWFNPLSWLPGSHGGGGGSSGGRSHGSTGARSTSGGETDVDGRPDLGWLGNVIRRQLDTLLEMSTFERYWLGQGDLQLSQEQFDEIKSLLANTSIDLNESMWNFKIDESDFYAYKVDFYETKYNGLLGRAWIIFDANYRAVGLYDRYDFNSKPWAARTPMGHFKTWAVRGASRWCDACQPFTITFGPYVELP